MVRCGVPWDEGEDDQNEGAECGGDDDGGGMDN